MAKSPDDRPATAARFGEVLRSAADSAGPGQATEPPTSRAEAATQIASPVVPGLPNPPAGFGSPTGQQPATVHAAASPPPGWAPPQATSSSGGGGSGAARSTPRKTMGLVLGGVAAVMILAVGAIVVINARDVPADPGASAGATTVAPVDPGGSTDTPPVSDPPVSDPLAIDTASVEGRLDALRQLADGTLATEALPDYEAYEPYADPRGVITVSIPTAWSDRADLQSEFGAALQAATNIAGAQSGTDDSAIGVYLYPKENLQIATVDEVLDEVARVNDINCSQQPAADFDHRIFAGRHRLYSACEGSDPDAMSIQLVGELKEDSNYFLQVSVVTPSPNDIAAANEILNSIEIRLNRL